MEVSQLKFYSIATVAANKKLSSPMIEAVPFEDTPFVDGELTDDAKTYNAKATDSNGSAYNVEVKTTASVKAEWLPINQSNRVTAPDVRRGEMVVLYRFADEDKFWWTTLRNDTRLRKLETVIYGFTATAVEDVDGNADNMYWLEVSTHRKLVHFHTSKANGEPFSYDIQINAGEGCIVIKDDAGNYFSFDSKAHRLEIMNQDGSHVDVNKTSIFLKATDTISLEADTITQKATTINETSTTQNIKASTLNSEATMNHTGTIASSGDVTAGNISLEHHTHKDADPTEGMVGAPQ